MNKVNQTCPICTQNGKVSMLELRQINLTEAVYICEDRICIYPIGCQWDYVKNNILEDIDSDSSDDSIDSINHEIINETKKSNKFQVASVDYVKSTRNNNHIEGSLGETYQKPNNNDIKTVLPSFRNNENSSIQTYDLPKKCSVASDTKQMNALNIISNVVLNEPDNLLSTINTKDYVKTNQIESKIKKKSVVDRTATDILKETVRQNSNVKFVNKKITKSRTHNSALPDSVIKNALALSQYFSNTKDTSQKPKKKQKCVVDIIRQLNDTKQKNNFNPEKNVSVSESIKSETSTYDQEDTSIVKIEQTDCINKENIVEVCSDNKYVNSIFENSLKIESQKINDDLAATFDDLLFNNTEKYEKKNEGFDFPEMDELLSLL